MAIVFDMSSGNIQSENVRDTRVTEPLEQPEIGPALQLVCEKPAAATWYDNTPHYIRELLKKI